MDIVWSCVITITLCIWTSVYGNVPAVKDTRWDRFRDKMFLAGIGLLGPEFLIVLSSTQWDSAQRSLKVRIHWSSVL